MALAFTVDGREVEVPDEDGLTPLLEVLRDRLGIRSPKDGCSPQGQCGCCTVLVDGQARVACVTPARRVAGRVVSTVDGLPAEERDAWALAFVAHGASQCGFCTPGIICRLAALLPDGPGTGTVAAVEQALLAHLCRCTGWRTIVEAATTPIDPEAGRVRDFAAASRRAAIEGGVPQAVGPDIALGRAGFADDVSTSWALVAVPAAPDGAWSVGTTLTAARAAAGKVQGRRTTIDLRWPIEVPTPDGEPWALTLQTTWVEPAPLEPDASWCDPEGEAMTPLANGGAFGAKSDSPLPGAAAALCAEWNEPVRALWSREDAVRLGPKRPPMAVGIRSDGTGVVRVVRTPGVAAAIAAAAIAAGAPGLVVEEVEVVGPPTSAALRGAGWAEAAVLQAALAGSPAEGCTVRSPAGATAHARIDPATGEVSIRVACGDPLDEIVLRSYCIGAAHMALGWVRSEGIAVDGNGEVHDLTIRSFGILRARDTPPIHVTIDRTAATVASDPVNGSDAVFAAVAAAAWHHAGLAPRWPVQRDPSHHTEPTGGTP